MYYEDLQRDPAAVLSGLAAHLGVRYAADQTGGLRKSTPDNLRRLIVNFDELEAALAPYPCLQRMLLAPGPMRFDDPCVSNGPERCSKSLQPRVQLAKREELNATHTVCYISWSDDPGPRSWSLHGKSSGKVAGKSNGRKGGFFGSGGGRRGRGALRDMRGEQQGGGGTSLTRRAPKESVRTRLQFVKSLRDDGLISESAWLEKQAKVLAEV